MPVQALQQQPQQPQQHQHQQLQSRQTPNAAAPSVTPVKRPSADEGSSSSNTNSKPQTATSSVQRPPIKASASSSSLTSVKKTDDSKSPTQPRHPSASTEPDSNSENGAADANQSVSGRKGKKKKANRACAACQKAHLTCDDSRPCARCIKKGIGDQCTDGKRKRAKYLLDEDELEAVKAKERAEKEEKERLASFKQEETGQGDDGIDRDSKDSQQPQPQSQYVTADQAFPVQQQHPMLGHPHSHQAQVPFAASSHPSQDASNQSNERFYSMDSGQMQGDSVNLGPLFGSDPFAAPADPSAHPNNTPPYAFGSESASLEYSILSAMLNGIDPSLLSGSPDEQDGLGGAGVGSNGRGTLNGGGGLTPSMELSNFLNTNTSNNGNGTAGGSTLPSVGMASDMSSPWLPQTMQKQGGELAGNGMPSGATPWASSSSAAATSSFAGASPFAAPSRAPLGQLHAIGGNDAGSDGNGEVGSGGFKALEVPSPSPSIVSARLGGLDEGRAGSSPPEVGKHTHNGIKTTGGDGSAIKRNAYQQQQQHPQQQHAHQYQQPGSNMFEAQWRERVNHIYASLTRPFPYTEGYHFLLKYVTENFEKAEVLRIVRALGLFRPSLIALQMPLTEEDEIFVERSIQRTVLEFEKLISFSGTPTVVWRRTCEICVAGSEFSMLTGWTRETLLGRRIYEFWDTDSTLEYWEKFASHAFENTSQSIVAKVVLKRPDGSNVPCAACFSIKRNVFDLPSLVVGAFLPILSSC
ncbi:unnamed protein product [Sympodiomycopsis kandeliae]